MTAQVGMRVLRGPDWASGDADGGEGHLGTVVALLDGHKVRVLWDKGQEHIYRSGADGKFDLRIFDSAPVGVRHPDTTCAACEERNIYGMMWRCKVCRSCNLCSLCYVMDKHDIKHEFLRYSEPGSSGESVKKRAVSLKVRAMGIFPGAKVKRGKDWTWADQDGGPQEVGEVTGFENVAPGSSRNIVRVQWPHGKTNSYRLGFQGNVDLMCVEEEAGTYYYRDHLPVLSTSGLPSSSSTSSSTSSMSSSSDNSVSFTSSSSSAKPSTASKSGATFEQQKAAIMGVGDKVVIHVNEDKLKELQLTCGGCTATMIRCIGKQGEVVNFAPNGAVAVKFDKISYRFNPAAITKVPELSVGDMVRIHSDPELVKMLNKHIGWKSDMEEALGKVGQVTKIDSDGDVVVTFGHQSYFFSPACCIPVSSTMSLDSLASESSDATSDAFNTSGSSNTSSSSDNDDYGELHRNLMQFIAQMAGVRVAAGTSPSGAGGTVRGTNGMDRLFGAIARGDTGTVRSICAENKSLVNTVHKGLTPLIVACHEGQKDVCSCLLAQGADINRQGQNGSSPLGAALEGKKEQIALYLLEKGAIPNMRNGKQRNPVHLAAYGNMPEAIKMLIQRGADVNAKDQYGDTPLHDAIDKDNADAVDMLLRAKTIDLQAENKKGFNILQHACLKGDAHATERILARDSGQVDKLLDGNFSALHIAANNDHVDCVKLLVKNGNARVDLEGHKKLTPLHMACMKGHVRSAEALVEMGAPVNMQDADGDTPLHLTLGTEVDNPGTLAGQHNLKQRIRLACVLLMKGAYPDLQNKKGTDPLQCCRYSGVRDAIKQFMQQNPSVIKKAGASTPRGGARRVDPTLGLAALLHGMSLPCGAAGCMRMSDITLMPCGHKSLCRNCCLNISECPLCDTIIERRIHRRSDSTVDVDLADACKQM